MTPVLQEEVRKQIKCGIEVKCFLVAPGHHPSNGINYMYVAQAYVSSTGIIQKNLHVECDM